MTRIPVSRIQRLALWRAGIGRSSGGAVLSDLVIAAATGDVSINSTEDGTLYLDIRETADPVPTNAEIIAGTGADLSGSVLIVAASNTLNIDISTLATEVEYTLRALLVYGSSQESNVVSDTFEREAASFTEIGAVFDGVDWMSRGSNFTGAVDAKQTLMFFSMEFTYAPGSQTFIYSAQSTSCQVQRTAGGTISCTWTDTTGVGFITMIPATPVIAAGERINILIILDADATSRMYIWRESTGLWAQASSDAAGGGANLEFTPGLYGLMARSNSNNRSPATLYRAAQWIGIAPDITSSTVQDLFSDPATGRLVDPAISVATYGTPIMDFYGGPTILNAGTNQGSGGNMTMNGTVT